MKTNRKRCKECKKQFVQYNSLTLVCGIKCAIEYARKDAAKAQRKIDRLNAKAKKDADREHRERKKAYNENSLSWLAKEAEMQCNKYIRMRDKDEPCISCGTTKPDIQYAAGHFIPKGRCKALRYDEANIHKQCNSYCNMHMSGNLIEYEKRLRLKIGDAEVERLKGPQEPVRYRADDYRRFIAHYKAKIKELGNKT